MKSKITKTLIAESLPKEKPYEINDTELKGFIARVQPSGIITYLISYRWQGNRNRVTIGQHPILTVAQARDEAVKILAGKVLGKDPGVRKLAKRAPPITLTLKSFIDDEYQKWCETNKKDGVATIKRIKSAFKGLLDLPLKEICALEVERWRTNRLTAGISPMTTNRDLNALASLFSSATEWKMVEINPLARFGRHKEDSKPKVRYLDTSEEKGLLEALSFREQEKIEARERANIWRAIRNYPLFPPLIDPLESMVILSLNTGLRWGELAKLTWDEINLDQAMLTVRGDTTKNTQTRYIPLNDNAKASLINRKKALGTQAVGLVYPGKDEEAKDNANRAWAGVKKRAGIKNFRWHDLRHTFASKLVMRGVDLNTVRELLGHADIKMTLRYAHLAPEHKAAAVAILCS